MESLIHIGTRSDIPQVHQGSPIGLLLEYHNFLRPFDHWDTAQLLVGMCIDNRKQLRIPPNFAFIIRAGGANMKYSEFKVSFAIAIGQVSHIALIGHNHCGMVNLASRQEDFIKGLVERAGWSEERARDHFLHFAPMFETHNEVDFVLGETKRLRQRYPKVTVVPMMFIVEDSQLYLIKE